MDTPVNGGRSQSRITNISILEHCHVERNRLIPACGTLAALDKARRLYFSDTASTDAIGQLGGGWIAEEALGIGVYCALKATDFEDGVIMAVNHDGDSDSTGLIAGHLLGATLGVSEIPARWLAPLELRDVIEEMADDLATVATWRLGDSDDPDTTAEETYYTRRYPGA